VKFQVLSKIVSVYENDALHLAIPNQQHVLNPLETKVVEVIFKDPVRTAKKTQTQGNNCLSL
jgi:hypothetical protein